MGNKVENVKPGIAAITGRCEHCHAKPAQCLVPFEVGAPLKVCWPCADAIVSDEATYEAYDAQVRACCA